MIHVIPWVRLKMVVPFSRISCFLVRMSWANSLSFSNELRNLALASYSCLSDSYSAKRFDLKSAKSFADLISYSSKPLMVSLNLSINDWTRETISLTKRSAKSLSDDLISMMKFICYWFGWGPSLRFRVWQNQWGLVPQRGWRTC